MIILLILIIGILIYAICKVNKLIIKILLLIPTVLLGIGFILAFVLSNIPALNNGGI